MLLFNRYTDSIFLPVFMGQISLKPNFKHKKAAHITYMSKSCFKNVGKIDTCLYYETSKVAKSDAEISISIL
jgi:hypothetical protein